MKSKKSLFKNRNDAQDIMEFIHNYVPYFDFINSVDDLREYGLNADLQTEKVNALRQKYVPTDYSIGHIFVRGQIVNGVIFNSSIEITIESTTKEPDSFADKLINFYDNHNLLKHDNSDNNDWAFSDIFTTDIVGTPTYSTIATIVIDEESIRTSRKMNDYNLRFKIMQGYKSDKFALDRKLYGQYMFDIDNNEEIFIR